MDCEQARSLFDAYLDGELSPTLATELGAHRVQCRDCRQDLALLEVSGHIVRSDPDSVVLNDAFTDRLLACVGTSKRGWPLKLRRWAYMAGPLAAAAVIAIGVWGGFDRETKVAGKFASGMTHDPAATTAAQRPPEPAPVAARPVPLDRTIERMRARTEAKLNSIEALQEAGHLSILQILDILNQAAQPPLGPVSPFDAGRLDRAAPEAQGAGRGDDVEDL
jgi:hypothetical protein